MSESTKPAQCRDEDWNLARDCGLQSASPGTNAWDAALGRFADTLRAAPPAPVSRAPVADEELELWANVRADDAGHLARELIEYRRAAQSAPVEIDVALAAFEEAACKQTYRMRDGVQAVLDLCRAAPLNEGGSEPDAYIEHHKGGDNLVWEDPGGKRTALYRAAPQPSAAPAALTDERAMRAALCIMANLDDRKGLLDGVDDDTKADIADEIAVTILAASPADRDARDAARYRWLLRGVCGTGSKGFDFVNLPPMPEKWFHGSISQHFSEAIDAAMSASKEGV
ncbi:hypothetical protein RA280_24555 [Cupriavidus sp. CV2]|uniref:hypothetical protein n=1 Tax=Cupriavidus ulmosensis TaxID=3065913 RepID=UPI00296B0495|nr:hypothetical protein [Cupriavidus sp. CV2]MDW3684865.1 hypothetical protein [Cupriavidus sp. CV2]